MASPVNSPKHSTEIPAHVELPETKANDKKHVTFGGVKVMDTAAVTEFNEGKRATKGARSKDTMESASGCCLDPVFGCVKSTYATVKPYIDSAIDFCAPYCQKVGEYISWAFNSLWALVFGAKDEKKDAKADEGTAASSLDPKVTAAKERLTATIDELQKKQAAAAAAADAAPKVETPEVEEEEGDDLEEVLTPKAATEQPKVATAAPKAEETSQPSIQELQVRLQEITSFRTTYADAAKKPNTDKLTNDLNAMPYFGPKIREVVLKTHRTEVNALLAKETDKKEQDVIDLFLKGKPEIIRAVVLQVATTASVALSKAEHQKAMANQAAIKKQFGADTIAAPAIKTALADTQPDSVGQVVADATVENKEREKADGSPATFNGEYVQVEAEVADDAKAAEEPAVAST